ncbi:MAG: hypothetical protein WCK57_09475 [Verrucomicrobiae bacterium]
MKYSNLIVAGLLGLGISAQAAIFYEGTAVSGGTAAGGTPFTQTIADGNPGGTWNSITVSGLGNSLSAISVTLNVTGGNNSGLYAYLTYNGTLAVLLNRPGVTSTTPFGDTIAGLTTTLTGTALYSSESPLASYTAFTTPGTSTSLNDVSIYGGKDPNGVWTLFFADVSAGGGNATLNGWSLDITAVPEPVNVALAGFAGAMLTVVGVRRYVRTNKTVKI